MPVDVESKLADLGSVWTETTPPVTATEVRERLDLTDRDAVQSGGNRTRRGRTRWLSGVAAALLVALVGSLAWLGRGGESDAPAVETATSTHVDEDLGAFDTSDPDWLVGDRVAASIVGETPNRTVIEIDRGATDGIRVGMPVVTNDGLVGKINSVGSDHSSVLTVESSQYAVRAVVETRDAAVTSESGPNGLLVGAGGEHQLTLGAPGSAEALATVAVGDEVVTAGGPESLAPPNIPIGRIGDGTTSDPDEVGVDPYIDLGSLSTVDVLLYVPPSEVDIADEPDPGSDVVAERDGPSAEPADYQAFGDMVMLGAAEELVDRGYFVDASVSRQLIDLVPLLDGLASEQLLGHVVVVHLGTNGPFTRSELEAVLAPLDDVPNVVMLNVHADRPWADENNRILADVVERYDNIILIDWNSRAAECAGDCFASDGVHLTEEGRDYYVDVIGEITGL